MRAEQIKPNLTRHELVEAISKKMKEGYVLDENRYADDMIIYENLDYDSVCTENIPCLVRRESDNEPCIDYLTDYEPLPSLKERVGMTAINPYPLNGITIRCLENILGAMVKA